MKTTTEYEGPEWTSLNLKWEWTKIIIWMPFAIVLTTIGLLICITIIGIPIGFALMSLGAAPLHRILNRMVRAHGAYRYQMQTLRQQELYEWEK